MNWVIPTYSKTQIRKAGECLAADDQDPQAYDLSRQILNEFRASHAYPLNTIQMSLRKYAGTVSSQAVVSQRLKRLPSIIRKLRQHTSMKLPNMQDVGGCRAILPTVKQARALAAKIKKVEWRHAIKSEYDYWSTPKESGYRSFHYVISHKTRKPSLGRLNDLMIEIQIRTQSQHAWATAVEVSEIIQNQALKASLGDQGWLQFFSYVGDLFAIDEGLPVFHTKLQPSEVASEVDKLEKSLSVIEKFRGFQTAMDHIPKRKRRTDDHFFLLIMNLKEKRVFIQSFTKADEKDAIESYNKSEETFRRPGVGEVVLVSVDKIGDLRKAYPNYYADTQKFVQRLESLLGRKKSVMLRSRQ